MELRSAGPDDVGEIVDIWVEAFRADPFFAWVSATEAFRRDWLTFIAELVVARGITSVDTAGRLAIAWVAPDVALVGPDDLSRGQAVLLEHGGEERAGEALALIMSARGHAPEGNHWTLQYIGAREGAQGQGLGRAAVEPMLARIDDEGLVCGLVSSNPRNVAFYERLGFEVRAELPSPDGAATLRPMHRTPVH